MAYTERQAGGSRLRSIPPDDWRARRIKSSTILPPSAQITEFAAKWAAQGDFTRVYFRKRRREIGGKFRSLNVGSPHRADQTVLGTRIGKAKMSKYGYPEAQWTAAKEEAKKILIERAKLRGMIPYSELVSRIHTISLEAHDPRLFHLLGDISSNEDDAGHGMLSVIVVHKDGDMQPGPSFFELAKQRGRNTSDILACWIDELKKVHAYWGKH